MNDLTRTALFVGCAAVLSFLAFGSRPVTVQPEAFSDEGEPFYADFTDPLTAASIEVISYDDSSGTATPFKVEVRDGVWSIPSHYDYPADGKDRLAKTAAAVIDLRKDIVQSDRIDDHAALGVIDPLDESVAALTGRGQRVTLRDSAGGVLADFIVGREVPGKNGFRYLRMPEKKRTYAVKVSGLDLSTRFEDWIETNLLNLTSTAIKEIEISDYTVDESTGRVDMRDRVVMANADNTWTMADGPAGSEVDQATMRAMVSALTGIRITGIRPKPASMSEDLRLREGLKLDLPTQMSLTSKGFFVSNDGRLLSNEGEVAVGTTAGVRCTLRFGEVVFGEGLEISAGVDGEEAASADDDAAGVGPENRYLFVTASFDQALLPTPPTAPTVPRPADDDDDTADDAPGDDTPADEAPAEDDDASNDDDAARAAWAAYDQAKADWDAEAERGRAEAESLNERFAEWYYVISGSDFGKIRLDRAKLLKTPEADPPVPG